MGPVGGLFAVEVGRGHLSEREARGRSGTCDVRHKTLNRSLSHRRAARGREKGYPGPAPAPPRQEKPSEREARGKAGRERPGGAHLFPQAGGAQRVHVDDGVRHAVALPPVWVEDVRDE